MYNIIRVIYLILYVYNTSLQRGTEFLKAV